MSKHVVVLGCPRSGTSIMSELFELAGFNLLFEPGIPSIRVDLNTNPRMRGDCVFKNPTDLQGGNRERAIKVRTPGLACDIDELDELLHHPRYVWIVRHPLDAVASLIPGLSKPGWMHGPAPPNWKDLEEPVERAIAMWLWLNETGAGQLRQRHDEVLLVRYEDLVRDTKKEARRVLAHVDVFDEAAVDVYDGRVSDDPKGYQAQCQSVWTQTNHAVHIGRWRYVLNEDQADDVWRQTKDVAEGFGYGRVP